ncbi:MAG TPA: hypothetical protein PK228_03990 [Saprospiraceae bacterium]|nr:hypothetical protein [Saprospiraceae bacterium]
MKNTIYLLFLLFFHPPLHAQGEKGQDVPPAGQKDTSAFNEVLETAYLLTAIGKYEDAHAYFTFVMKDFSDKQVYNNAGVVAILAARNYFRPNEPEVKFHYPIELDLVSKGKKGGNDFKEIRTRLLREAISHFDAAIHLDTGYAPAYLNRACAYALLDEVPKAQSEANRAAALRGYDKTAVDVQVLMGILHARLGDSEKAKAYFESAVKQGSTLAANNLKKLEGGEIPAPSGTFDLPGGIETIDNISLTDPNNIPEPDPNSEIALTSQIRLYHNLNPGPNSRFYFSDNTATGQQTFFLLTGPGYAGQTEKKLKIGAARAEIEAAYKEPLRRVETPAGEIRVYPSIILLLGKDGELAQWAIFGEDG